MAKSAKASGAGILARRGLIALGLAVVGAVSVVQAAAEVINKVDPVQAARLDLVGGRITAAGAERSFAASPSKDANSGASVAAKRALLSDPTAVKAASVLGFQAQLRGENTAARRIFLYSLMLSRREMRSHVWAIEDGVSRGDIGAILRSYDMALRTSRSARETLIAPLANGLGEATLRDPIAQLLVDTPVWKEDFLEYVAQDSRNAKAGALFFQTARARRVEIPEKLDALLISRLTSSGDFEDAWAHYASYRGDVDRSRGRDPAFQQDDIDRADFDWHFIAGSGVSADILRNGREGEFAYAAPSSYSGPLLRQRQMLPPGNYRLKGSGREIAQSPTDLPYWSLTCQDGREIGRVELKVAPEGRATFDGRLSISSDCPTQLLTLQARSSANGMDLAGELESASLMPVARSGREAAR